MSDSIILYVHSSITVYLARTLLKKQFPQVKNVVVIYDRLQETELAAFKGININLLKTIGDRFIAPKNALNSIRKIKKLIKENVPGNFSLVIPHLLYESLQVIAKDKNCKKIFYLEEGDLNYISKEEMNLLFGHQGKFVHKKNIRSIFSLGNLYERHPFPAVDKPFEMITFSEAGFPYPEGKKTIYPFKEVFTDPGYHFQHDYNNATILLINKVDLQVWKKQPDVYTKGLEKVLDYIKINFGSHLFLKPHPALSTKKDKMQELLGLVTAHGLTAHLVEDPIELVLVNCKNVKLVTSTSSLVRYAVFAGNKPYFWWKAHVKPGSAYAKILDQLEGRITYI